jgi:hypothetical protein
LANAIHESNISYLYPDRYVDVAPRHKLSRAIPHSVLLSLVEVPYQTGGEDCGVFVCKYACSILKVARENAFTYASAEVKLEGGGIVGIPGADGGIDGMRTPFAQLVTEREEFSFDMSYIQHLRRDMKTLLEKLSIIYGDWKEEQTGATSDLIQRARVEGGSSQETEEKKPKPSGEFQCTHDRLKLAAITDLTVF